MELSDPQSERWAIWCDYQITRRKRYHAVKDPQGRWRFESRYLWECVEWLDAEGVPAYEMRAGGRSKHYVVEVLFVSKGQP